ncbi:hypothetical protein BpHYR1_022518, partial [Brachionus plicatilis]
YKIGDWVLANHPKLKKGLSQGIARKYYGPFEIVGVNPNGVDYFIKRTNAKIKQEIESNEDENNQTNKISNNKTSKTKRHKKTKVKRAKIINTSTDDESSDKPRYNLRRKRLINDLKTSNKTMVKTLDFSSSDEETLAQIKQKLKF